VKLPYLVDVIATKILGRPITEGRHEAWQFGAVTKEAWNYLEGCGPSSTPFHVAHAKRIDDQIVRVEAASADVGLSPDEEDIVDFVSREFSDVFATELGFMTKAMNPSIATWVTARHLPVDMGPDAYDRLTAEYQSIARLAASVSLETLREKSTPISCIEDIVA
jgi:uncharacterized phage-associated protein